MTYEAKDYALNLEPIPAVDGGGWLVTWPDLPDCFSSGDTIEEAVANANDAATSYLEILEETGRSIPKPGSHRDLSIPQRLEEQIADYAETVGLPFNILVEGWLQERMAV